MTQLAHFIDGARIPAGPAAHSINPSDISDVIAEVPRGDADIVDQAVQAAARAGPSWASLSPERRADILDNASRIIRSRAVSLGTLLSREEGKTLAEGIGEVQRAARIFSYFAGESLRRHGRCLDSVRPDIEVTTRLEPVGVVGLITPWNFPIAIPAWKAAPALAFGNTVVMKAAEITSATASALADVLDEAGVPAGVFNLVFVPGAVAGSMANHPLVNAISFTGSTSVGRRLAETAVANGTRIQLEMGGKNPLVVLDDADLDTAVAVALDGSYFSSGQRCTASSRLIVTDGIHDRFVAALGERLAAIRVGHALAPDTQIGPVASEDQMESITGYILRACNEGANLMVGGDRLKRDHDGYYLAPALITETSPHMQINRDEVFGPVASALRVPDYDAALAAANDTKFGLSAGIVTTSLRYAHDFRRQVRAGMVMVNVPTAGVDYHVPFGGTNGSSYGSREQGFAAVEFYTQSKTSYLAW